MVFMVAIFAVKNAMFNLNESNRIVMAQHPTDMRMGVNCLSGRGQIGRTGSFERRRLYFCGQIPQGNENPALGARRIRGLLQAA